MIVLLIISRCLAWNPRYCTFFINSESSTLAESKKKQTAASKTDMKPANDPLRTSHPTHIPTRTLRSQATQSTEFHRTEAFGNLPKTYRRQKVPHPRNPRHWNRNNRRRVRTAIRTVNEAIIARVAKKYRTKKSKSWTQQPSETRYETQPTQPLMVLPTPQQTPPSPILDRAEGTVPSVLRIFTGNRKKMRSLGFNKSRPGALTKILTTIG